MNPETRLAARYGRRSTYPQPVAGVRLFSLLDSRLADYVPVMFLSYPQQVTIAETAIPFFLEGLCAGFPSPAEDHIDRSIDLADLLVPNPPATFFWRVDGHSMKDAGIHHDDILVIDRSLEPRHGDIVVALVDGAMSVKRLLAPHGKAPRLVFENREFPVYPISADNGFEIWGVVTCNLHFTRGRGRR